MAVVGYLLKLKRDLGLAFNTPSIDKILMLYHFFFSFNTISIDIVSISYLFFFSRYQTKFVIKSLFKSLFILIQSMFSYSKLCPKGNGGERPTVKLRVVIGVNIIPKPH